MNLAPEYYTLISKLPSLHPYKKGKYNDKKKISPFMQNNWILLKVHKNV